MKKTAFLILLGILTFSGMEAAPLFTLKPVSPRFAEVSVKQELELIQNGKSQMVVYVPAKAPRPVSDAAREFAGILGGISGKMTAVTPPPPRSPSDAR